MAASGNCTLTGAHIHLTGAAPAINALQDGEVITVLRHLGPAVHHQQG
jgi:hypothetical protein